MLEILKELEILKLKVDQFRPISADLQRIIQEKLRVDWTYNSNAIEGNTLTYGETMFFLREGLTSEGKPFKDYLETKNHAQAIDLLQDYLRSNRQLSEGLIKELHALLLKDIEFTYAKGSNGQMVKKTLRPGKYKLQPNHVLTVSGQVHHYTAPLQVPVEMEKLLRWFHTTSQKNVIEKAAVFHYRFVSIHPFDDGNGRLSRLLMNLILMKEGYQPCIIKNEHRRQYLASLNLADSTQDISSFIEFVASELKSTFQLILSILEGHLQLPFNENLSIFQRENLILQLLSREPKSISQILSLAPSFKRPTLKKDLKKLLKQDKISRQGRGKGTMYLTRKFI